MINCRGLFLKRVVKNEEKLFELFIIDRVLSFFVDDYERFFFFIRIDD